MGTRKRKADDFDSSAFASSSTGPAPGLKRQKKDSNAEPVEKRLARFKPSCPKNIMERVNRVLTQRFFMIDRQRTEGQLREEFKVLGSTYMLLFCPTEWRGSLLDLFAGVYTVIIDKLPSCNCPDATKGNHCKHILFVFLKVLSVSINSTLYYQKALLSTELEVLFTNAPVAPNSVSHPRVQALYAKATGRPDEAAVTESKADEGEQKRRIPGEGDDCPICYESMHDVDVKTLTFCDECGNALHTECFQQWAGTAKPLTCVWCRAKWAVVANTAGGSSAATASTSEGYLNLGAAAGVSPLRDTSSYYKGPRHGQGWGYERFHRYY